MVAVTPSVAVLKLPSLAARAIPDPLAPTLSMKYSAPATLLAGLGSIAVAVMVGPWLAGVGSTLSVLVVGPAVSTWKVLAAGVASVFPAVSTARTLKVWLPSA